MPGNTLRTNYRLTGGQVFANDLASIFPHLRETVIIDSADLGITLSMQGYGVPSWVVINPVGGFPTHIMIVHTSVAAANSLVYATLWAVINESVSTSLGAWGASQSMPFEYFGLIGSR